MYIQNATYKAIPTGSLSFPITQGSVVTAGGVTGIVTEGIAVAPPTAQIYIAVGGTIDMTSPANKGVTFTDEELKALGGDFNFVPIREAGASDLPEVDNSDNGDVLAVVDGAWAKSAPPSGLPTCTSEDVGKVLTVVRDAEHSISQVVIPEQTLTLVAGVVNVALFDEDSGVDFEFFESAEVGDTCFISLNNADPVECTAENVYGMVLFPIGDYYVGNGDTLGGVGVASFEATGDVTISATADIPQIVAGWRTNWFVLEKSFWASVSGESEEEYTILKAAYDEGAKLFIRDTSNKSTGALYALDYDADDDKFVAKALWIADGTAMELVYGTYTIDPTASTDSKTGICKVQMSTLV